ncbi:MAG: tail protein [Gemmatimonadales bacterium]|nr:tail protein [Gemmatimonadales bacterium]
MPTPVTLEESKWVRYQRLIGQLDLERSAIWSDWRDLNDWLLPTRGRFFLGSTERNRARSRRSKQIIDSTGSLAARTLSSGMMSGITSPARPWFRLTTPDPDLAEFASVKQWLHVVTERMSTVFIRSNVYNKLPLIYQDLGVFGTAAMFVEESDRTVIRCSDFPIGSYYLSNDYEGRIGVFAREFQMTVRQLVKRFGLIEGTKNIEWSRFSSRVKNAWDLGQGETYIDVAHVIEPNDEYDGERFGAQFKKFRACYFERGSPELNMLLEESGFDEFPVLAPRWEVTGEDAYGTSCPGMIALGDVKALQTMKKRGLQAVDKKVSPPMVAGTSMKNSPLSILPGGVSYVDESQHQKFRAAFEVNLDLSDLHQEQAEVRRLISRSFYEDLFLMLSYGDDQRGSQPPTAREIDERHEEKLLALGPVLEQLNQDLLDPLIERAFEIMYRRGMIPPAPPELEGVELKVEYISIMAQAQKAVGRAAIQDFSAFLIAQVEATPNDPSILDVVDRDQMVQEYGDRTGIPPRIVRSDEQVQAIRDKRAQQQEAQRQAEVIAQNAKSAKDLASADTSGKNALTDIMGNLGGAAPGLARSA